MKKIEYVQVPKDLFHWMVLECKAHIAKEPPEKASTKYMRWKHDEANRNKIMELFFPKPPHQRGRPKGDDTILLHYEIMIASGVSHTQAIISLINDFEQFDTDVKADKHEQRVDRYEKRISAARDRRGK